MAPRRHPGWLFGLAVLLIVGAGVLGWLVAGVTAETEVPPAPLRPPPTRLSTLDGTEVALEDYLGRVVVVDFWASWCAPCRLQGKILDRMHRELGDDAVQFLAINLGEDRETIERYLADEAVSYPVLMDPEERLGFGLEIYVLPTVMVLDRDGGITYFHQGISDRPRLAAALAAAGVQVAPERPS